MLLTGSGAARKNLSICKTICSTFVVPGSWQIARTNPVGTYSHTDIQSYNYTYGLNYSQAIFFICECLEIDGTVFGPTGMQKSYFWKLFLAFQWMEPVLVIGTHMKRKISASYQLPKTPIFNTAKRSLHLTLSLISLKLISKTEWDLCPLKTHRFILNTKPFLTDIRELRYLQNIFDKKGIY